MLVRSPRAAQDGCEMESDCDEGFKEGLGLRESDKQQSPKAHVLLCPSKQAGLGQGWAAQVATDDTHTSN